MLILKTSKWQWFGIRHRPKIPREGIKKMTSGKRKRYPSFVRGHDPERRVAGREGGGGRRGVRRSTRESLGTHARGSGRNTGGANIYRIILNPTSPFDIFIACM
ncbi:hypothetical protein TNIN_7171 [Trichonephila inaurata madagascariensis]|uniref:Uncharacterized protein n=1 Tax=Trichonephila inaurata madagascariensis TaxID=2747483 RepID=A0A8X6YPP7_9ARAC|nr:hypothetical protein TNIN_7171 [Trichonephila inaurata madagascariensis]